MAIIIPTPTLDINLKLESLFKTFLSQENVGLYLFGDSIFLFSLRVAIEFGGFPRLGLSSIQLVY